ncbi:MAG: D-alanyl-D-alanine carboxypeptidase [Bdellovibrio sp.]
MKKRGLGLGLVLLLIANVAMASDLRAACYLQDQEGEEVHGVNLDRRLEIASVSKVMTAYWAIKKLGVDARFTTAIHIKKVDDDLYDVHFQGSRDPYTGRDMLQYVVGELNRLGITKVRRLTFDEKFKFLADVRGVAAGHFTPHTPDADTVMRQIRSVISSLSTGYPSLQARAQEVHNMQLPRAIKLTAIDISLLESSNFDAREFDSAYLYRSANMQIVLKEMNRNSNNHAANQIFESLGGAEAFARFIKADLGLDEGDIRFINGSGDRHDVPDGQPLYNEASCRSIIKVLVALRTELRKTDRYLQDVMAVAGSDAEGERSTVTALYNNDETGGALIAKTGTVNPSISLAGLVSTEEGRVYFGSIYSADGTASSWHGARGQIRAQVVKLFQKFGGRRKLDYKAVPYFAFDRSSGLQKLENRAAEARSSKLSSGNNERGDRD